MVVFLDSLFWCTETSINSLPLIALSWSNVGRRTTDLNSWPIVVSNLSGSIRLTVTLINGLGMCTWRHIHRMAISVDVQMHVQTFLRRLLTSFHSVEGGYETKRNQFCQYPITPKCLGYVKRAEAHCSRCALISLLITLALQLCYLWWQLYDDPLAMPFFVSPYALLLRARVARDL